MILADARLKFESANNTSYPFIVTEEKCRSEICERNQRVLELSGICLMCISDNTFDWYYDLQGAILDNNKSINARQILRLGTYHVLLKDVAMICLV